MGKILQQVGQTAVFCLVGVIVFVASGCGSDATPPSISLLAATTTVQPTPSLAPGLPTAPLPSITPTTADTSDPEGPDTTAPSRTPLPTLTPVPSPTIAPEPVTVGDDPLAEGNFAVAADQFESALAADALAAADRTATLFNLGVAYLEDGRFTKAANTFNQLLATDGAPIAAFFYLGRAYEGQGDVQRAIDAYQSYLEANPDTAAYVAPIIAQAYLALDDRASAIAAYETAVSVPANRFTEVANRFRLAEFYLAAGRVDDAIAQHDAVRSVAETEFTRGQATYLAGMAELNRGNSAAAFERFRTGITQYPRAYESYLGLVQLVDAGQPVDEYRRGLVNYHADSFQPCVAAFDRYVTAAPEDFRPDAYLYSAYCYEGLGNLDAALAQLTNYETAAPARAQIERANLYARVGNGAAALDAYRTYVTEFPDGPDAAYAAWQTAVLTEAIGDTSTAVAAYRQMAQAYPTNERAPTALFHGGWLAYQSDDVATAVALWQQAAEGYPAHADGAAAMVWLLRTLPLLPHATPTAAATSTVTATQTVTATETVTSSTAVTETAVFDPEAMLTSVEALVQQTAPLDYYHLRAQDIVNGVPPFSIQGLITIPDEAALAAAQVEAEAWLRDRLALPPGMDVSTLSPELADDYRLVVGEKLWRIGLSESARRELESLRAEVADDALASYQLALYFRDLGLYRSSILAATAVQNRSGQTLFDVPRFIGMLMYPTYYADLILPLAEQYGYDPRLQFSLVRQESLFESFARSGAAAQGLSQVIPDTGAYIATKLNWPDYENADLYRPYVGLNFGAYYLAEQLATFDGDVHAALAAYNAGPGNAARWHAQAGSDHDLFVEIVNFPETRLYIERIYVGYVLYSYLYGE